MLRIYAPDTPFSTDTLKVVFELFVSQLRGVADPRGQSFARYYYLLERLAMVKSFVLMLDLNCDDLVRQLFETLFESISADHSIRVESHMLDILVTVLEEIDAIPQMLIDVILENLLASAKSEKPASYALARSLLAKCAKVLHRPLNEFMQACLPTGAATIDSDHKEEWPRLLVELASVNVDLVAYLLPQLNEVVSIDDEATRLKGVELLAELLRLPANLVHAYPQLLHALLAKFTDVSVAVRCTAIEHGISLAQQPSLTDAVVAALKERVLDPEEKVRAALVHALCDACAATVRPFGPLIESACHRMLDKREGVRSATRSRLSQLYCRHLSDGLRATGGKDTAAVELPDELRGVPKKLLQCYGVEAGRDLHSKLEIETLLATKLLPSAPELRLPALCVVHATLDPPQRKAFGSLLRCKRSAQGQIGEWLALSAKLKENRSDADAKAKLDALVATMSREMVHSGLAKEVWDQLGQTKDKGVAKALLALASPASTYKEATGAQDELRRRMSARLNQNQTAVLVGIASRPAMTLMCRESAKGLLTGLCKRLDKAEKRTDDEAARDVSELELLTDFATLFPEVISSSGEPLVSALAKAHAAADACNAEAQLLLKVVHAASGQIAAESKEVRKQLVSTLCQSCCGKDAALGKLAAQCLTTKLLAPALRSRTFATLVSKLRPAIDGKAGPQQHTALTALGVLGKRTPDAFGDERR